jgi:hypothetical protein
MQLIMKIYRILQYVAIKNKNVFHATYSVTDLL